MNDTDGETELSPFEKATSSSLQRRTEAAAVPELVDATAALDIVRRYVESERRRNRRIVVWTSTVAFFVVVFVLTAFISIGVFVLSRTRQTSDRVDAVEERASVYVRGVAAATNRMMEIEGLSRDIAREFREGERERIDAVENVKLNLQRFSRWVRQTGETRGEQLQSRMEDRLARIEARSRERDKELDTLRKDYGFLQAEYASLQTELTRRATPERRADVPRSPLGAAGAGGDELDLDNLLAALDQAAPLLSDPSWSAPVAPSDLEAPREDAAEPRSILEEQPEEAAGIASTVEFPNGDRYQGKIKYGLLHGWGIYTTAKGDRYEGNFKYDMREGEGTLIFADGDKYIGEFHDDKMSGKGVMIYRDGSRYTGEFRDGRKNGKGVMRFANGDTYSGDFNNDERTGFGTYDFADGDRYTGEFLKGLRHGQGRYTYAAGGEYVGEFKDGKKQGEGVSRYPNGKQIKGLWEDDQFIKPLPM